jgi:hypothetical protein
MPNFKTVRALRALFEVEMFAKSNAQRHATENINKQAPSSTIFSRCCIPDFAEVGNSAPELTFHTLSGPLRVRRAEFDYADGANSSAPAVAMDLPLVRPDDDVPAAMTVGCNLVKAVCPGLQVGPMLAIGFRDRYMTFVLHVAVLTGDRSVDMSRQIGAVEDSGQQKRNDSFCMSCGNFNKLLLL